MSIINERLDRLKEEIQEEDFLAGKGLSNEANIHIFCYDPKEEMIIRYYVSQLVVDQSLQCTIHERNLYNVFLSVCDERRLTDKIPMMEEKRGKDGLIKHLVGQEGKSGPAGIKAIVQKMNYFPHRYGDIVLITGVGASFPFVRVHSVLEAMQSQFADVPVVVMYPGKYDGRFVRLFDRLEPNPYYRAFNIIGADSSNNHVL